MRICFGDKFNYSSLQYLSIKGIFISIMKQVKTQNIEKIKISNECYFVKPFEIVSAYSSFADTWKVANNVCRNISEVNDVCLMHSLSEYSNFGFISYSKWYSRSAYKNSLENNTILKYHHEINGSGSKSNSENLYKLVCNSVSNNIAKLKLPFQVYIFELDSDCDDSVINYWNNLIIENNNNNVKQRMLLKSFYKNSKYRFIGLVYYDSADKSLLNSVLFEAKDGFNVYSSFYQIIKKI